MDGYKIPNVILRHGRLQRRHPRSCKLFVGNLAFHTTTDTLGRYFKVFGTVVEATVVRDPITETSRGFGFIRYTRASAITRALALQPHTIDAREVDVKAAIDKRRKRRRESPKIFVGGVSQLATSEELRDYFSRFGVVVEAYLVIDRETRMHRRFGFVTFQDEAAVDRVCLMHYHLINDRAVECKRARPSRTMAIPTRIWSHAETSATLTTVPIGGRNESSPSAEPFADQIYEPQPGPSGVLRHDELFCNWGRFAPYPCDPYDSSQVQGPYSMDYDYDDVKVEWDEYDFSHPRGPA